MEEIMFKTKRRKILDEYKYEFGLVEAASYYRRDGSVQDEYFFGRATILYEIKGYVRNRPVWRVVSYKGPADSLEIIELYRTYVEKIK